MTRTTDGRLMSCAEILTLAPAMTDPRSEIERNIDTLGTVRNWQEWARGSSGQSITAKYGDLHCSEVDPQLDYLTVEKIIASLDLGGYRSHFKAFRWSIFAHHDTSGSDDQRAARLAFWGAVKDAS